MKARNIVILVVWLVFVVNNSAFSQSNNASGKQAVINNKANSSSINMNQPITIVDKYVYTASEADSKISSRANALNELKRQILERVGTYVVSYTEVQNLQVSKDKIEAWTAGVIKLQILKEDWDGKIYIVEAKMVLNPDDVTNALKAISRDVELAKDLEKSQRLAIQAREENEKLRAELEKAKTDTTISQATMDRMTKRAEGEKYLTMAMEAAKWSEKEAEADRLEKKAIELLGEAYVRSVWPKEVFYSPRVDYYSFGSLKAGERLNFWIRLAKDASEINFGSENGDYYIIEFADGTLHNPKENRAIEKRKEDYKFRFKAISDCKELAIWVKAH